MKKLLLNVSLTLLFTVNCISQIKINNTDNTIIGQYHGFPYHYVLNINGNGSFGENGHIAFGYNTGAAANTVIGEYGTTDSNALLLHGNNGIHFSTTLALNTTKMFLSEAGYLGIGSTDPQSKLTVGIDNGQSLATLSAAGPIGHNNRTIRVYQSVSGAQSNYLMYGIYTNIEYASGGYKLIGVFGNASRGTTPTNARNYGIYGVGGNGYNGYNFGVYGRLTGSRNGAAVFGTITDDPMPYVDDEIEGKYAGYFLGDVHITGHLDVDGTYPSSDINLKKEIQLIDEDVLRKLDQLQCIRFKLKHPSEYKEISGSDTTDMERLALELESEKYTRVRIGLIAQELQSEFPEIVKKGNDGFLKVNYTELIPILVQAINQQQKQIEALELAFNEFQNSAESEMQIESKINKLE